MNDIAANLSNIREIIGQAAARSGRPAEAIRLIAVTKTRSAEEINQAIATGITDIGENRVQEILDKYEAVHPVRWHMIGHLQTNKVKYIIDKVSLIHSVDSLRLAQEIQRRTAEAGHPTDILIQINPALEESKSGVSALEAEQLLTDILQSCPDLRVRGLMSMVPLAENPEAVRGYFREARNLYEKLRQKTHANLDFQYLSMGMSNDFTVAIEEGADTVRIGSAIFGERN